MFFLFFLGRNSSPPKVHWTGSSFEFYDKNIPLGTEILTSVEFKKEHVKRSYKNIVLIGDNCIFNVSDSNIAQDVAYTAIATGVGHMAPRGFSTVIQQYRKED